MIPRLIHPITISIVQITGGTVDADFREPTATTTATVTAQGQVNEKQGQRFQATAGGDTRISNASGHVVFEIDALARANIVLHVGDRITQVGSRVLSPAWRVLRIEDHAQYGGRAWHRWAFFAPEDS